MYINIFIKFCITLAYTEPSLSYGSLDLQLPMQPVSINTNVVSSNTAQVRCTRYNILW
jgi:hypothetical protein